MSTYSPLRELNLLMDFQDVMGFGSYAPGFGLTEFGDFFALGTRWSAQPAFLDRLISFAQADEDGSFYAFWRVDDTTALAHMPVVVFGAGDGTHVVAADIRALLRVLALSPLLRIDRDQASYVCDTPSIIEPDPEDDILLSPTGPSGIPVHRADARRTPAMDSAAARSWSTDPSRPQRHPDYVEWLDEVLGLAPAADCSTLVAEARIVFAEPYRRWADPYLLASSPE